MITQIIDKSNIYNAITFRQLAKLLEYTPSINFLKE